MLLCAKHLFVATMVAGVHARLPGTGKQDMLAGQVRVRSAGVIHRQALPPVLKDLLFRAKDLFMAAMVPTLPPLGPRVGQL